MHIVLTRDSLLYLPYGWWMQAIAFQRVKKALPDQAYTLLILPMVTSPMPQLEFDGPSGRSTHVAGLQEGGGSCKLELSLGKLNGVITMTLTVTYFKPPQPEPEAPLAGADAGQPPPAKRKAKSKK